MKVIQSLNELIKFGEAHKHINVLTVGQFGLSAYTVLYEKILKGHSIAEAIEGRQNPRNQIERNIIDLNINNMLRTSSNQNHHIRKIFFEQLAHLFAKDSIPSSLEWFKGFYLATAECFGRKYTDRLVPSIFYDRHSVDGIYEELFQVAQKQADCLLDELYEEFDEELIVSICRDPMTKLGSYYDAEFASNSKSHKYYNSPLSWIIDALNDNFSVFINQTSILYPKWRIVRFEDLKLHPHETLTKLCEFLHIPKTDSMLVCTINGKESKGFMGTFGFDPAPVYKKHDKYLGTLDRYRLEMLHQKDYQVWGYKLKYYNGMIYTPTQIKKLFSLPYSIERAFWGNKLLASKLKRDIVEFALDIIKNGESIPHDENGNPMVPVKWLKPDLPEGEKLYE